ncbi:MAG: hydantoinase/oxoprolinase family protein [Candidatus Limnocylindrales bacterium]|jgi:N-methylhydantoinase A
MIRVGVDTGGTFTDFVTLGPEGMRVAKYLSTPADPSRAVLTGVEAMAIPLAEVDLFGHGTTITTNAAIQRRGVPTGLITTRGFRDVLQIRRTTRGELYNFQWEPPVELVPRNWRREVTERTAASGVVLTPPDLEEVVRAAADLVAEGVQSLAIVFINSYANGETERLARDAILEHFPELPVYISSEILPEWREFERTSTTVVSAYIGPTLAGYLARLETTLHERGYGNDLLSMASNGGLSTTTAALRRPGYSIGSGPAAGVVAQIAIAAASAGDGTIRYPNLIGMDIGGTSTDISIVAGGLPSLRSELELEFGTTIAYPVIDIGSIGAGGGTIAWIDRGGMLELGPHSAGADPGPACLGRGGKEPTVTDATVVLGRQNPHELAGGTVRLEPALAAAAVEELGARLGLDRTSMASGILELAVAHIVFAIRQRTVERGLDPRDFALLAYGGGGPLLAAAVAEELGVSTVLVPPNPGVTSALGLLLTDVRHDIATTFLRVDRSTPAEDVAASYLDLERSALQILEREGFRGERTLVMYSADLRYLGQTHELNIAIPRPYDASVHARLPELLADRHRREFGHAPGPETPIEMVNLRVAGIGRIDHPALPHVSAAPRPEPVEVRRVFHREWLETPVYVRDGLGRGTVLEGPSVVEQLDATTLIPPGWEAEVDAIGSMVLRPKAR